MGGVPPLTSPLAEAIEEYQTACRAWLDGPGAAAQRAATNMERPDYNATVAGRDAMLFGLQSVRAMLLTAISFTDAVAGLSDPPSSYQDHRIHWSPPAGRTGLACTSISSLTPFPGDDLVNPALKADATLEALEPQDRGRPCIRIRVRPVPATPDLTLILHAIRDQVSIGTVRVTLTADTRW